MNEVLHDAIVGPRLDVKGVNTEIYSCFIFFYTRVLFRWVDGDFEPRKIKRDDSRTRDD